MVRGLTSRGRFPDTFGRLLDYLVDFPDPDLDIAK